MHIVEKQIDLLKGKLEDLEADASDLAVAIAVILYLIDKIKQEDM